MFLQSTLRFSVLSVTSNTIPKTISNHLNNEDDRNEDQGMKTNNLATGSIPWIPLSRFFLSSSSSSSSSSSDHVTNHIQKEQQQEESILRQDILHALETYGYLVLTLPRTSKQARVVQEFQDCLHSEFFPDEQSSSSVVVSYSYQSEDDIYISEIGIPMWRVGYENSCQSKSTDTNNNDHQGDREAFRVPVSSLSDVIFPSSKSSNVWKQTCKLCQRICDRALELTLPNCSTVPTTTNRSRHTRNRQDDLSVLYAMHYFNTNIEQKTIHESNQYDEVINVKPHVDPSLFVLEPFIPEQPGLQIWSQGQWVTCDGPESPIYRTLDSNDTAMVLFVGKAFHRHCPQVEPTLHRVIATKQHRRIAAIFEQKYREYYPPPTFD
jgi:hypothetical protein